MAATIESPIDRSTPVSNEQIYLVEGVRVTFLFQESGPQWTCAECANDCSHILIAATRMTLESWAQTEAAVDEDRDSVAG